MQIELSPEQEAIVHSRIDSGRYATPEDVLSSALQLLESFDSDFNNTHALIEEGHRDIEAGRVHDVDEVFDELLAELDEKINSSK
jgi:antitoxin ParD1/3/4